VNWITTGDHIFFTSIFTYLLLCKSIGLPRVIPSFYLNFLLSTYFLLHFVFHFLFFESYSTFDRTNIVLFGHAVVHTAHVSPGELG